MGERFLIKYWGLSPAPSLELYYVFTQSFMKTTCKL